MQTTHEIPARGPIKAETSRLSKDGKWKSFAKAPNLLQYVPSGVYYARVKIDGKLFRSSLETKIWTTAKLRLADFVKEKREPKAEPNLDLGITVEAATEIFKTQLAHNVSMKETSKNYRLLCVGKIQSTWPELSKKSVGEITPEECQKWGAKLKDEIASQYFNNVVGTIRMIFDAGLNELKKRTGKSIPNPASGLSKAKILPRILKLPESSEFRAMVDFIQAQNSWGKAAAELVEFLAYSGTRLYTEAQWTQWEHVDLVKKEIVIHGNPQTRTKNWDVRRIPILPNMEDLINRLKTDRTELKGKILRIVECPATLKKACKAVGITPLRHHDLRHLFATRCIESGVDIPTVARWLGHKDGGALAMKTYGHLRNEHSQAMAAKVKF